jgi:uncharacterized protein (DUF362 family)/Pyruvate/2-oxoacid:ferredoxin oxidoreductase delta subunit
MTPRVAVIRCKNYDREIVFPAIHSILEYMGGIECFVKRGQKVLLKPNMLSAKSPKKGITTHPIILEALIKEMQSVDAEVWIGDSPSGAIKGIQRCWDNTGFSDVARKTGAKLVNFEAGGTTLKEIDGIKYYLSKYVMEADVIINLPKFKTHGLTLYTGAIKNLYGTLPGLQKAAFHKRCPNPENFSRRLVDIYSLVNPHLHLMDGILGMEGNGPATGDRKNVGLLLASTDGVALDTIAGHIMGFKENEIDTNRLAGERGLGENRVDNIEVVGERLENVVLKDFSLPSNRLIKLIPPFLVRWMSRFIWVRPRADLDKCTSCAVCVKGCPVDAIEMLDSHPVMDYHLCINCLCCNESCPEDAIIQDMSWIARRIG